MTAGAGTWAEFARQWHPRVEQQLDRLLPADGSCGRLGAAMRHAMFPGGKRLRPLLALLAARASGGDPEKALVAAAGLECLHTYSLVHDDLPCMDDDELRRGRPTCHVAFGEATAVLAGDALQALAFEAVASGGAEAVAVFARAAGALGMVGGQQLDMDAEGALSADPGQAENLARLEAVHDKKTGALITASLEVGALAGGGAPEALPLLREYGRKIGRAFQIADDCLDVTATQEQLGKGTGQDAAADKLTYPAVLGLEASLACARRLAEEAAGLAARISGAARGSALDADVQLLQDVAFFTVGRKA